MVKKLITLAAVCTAAAMPIAEAFAPQGPISSKVISTGSQSIAGSKLFMSEDNDGGVSITIWNNE